MLLLFFLNEECVIDTVLLVSGSTLRCCLFRVEEPVVSGGVRLLQEIETHLRSGFELMLKIQAVAAFLKWCR